MTNPYPESGCFRTSTLQRYLQSHLIPAKERWNLAVLKNLSPILIHWFFNKFIYLFIYFWLCWVFIAVRGLSLLAGSRGYSSCGVRTSHWVASLVAEHRL